eukprot:7256154-Lingulodinium_polyedra.AAC.1
MVFCMPKPIAARCFTRSLYFARGAAPRGGVNALAKIDPQVLRASRCQVGPRPAQQRANGNGTIGGPTGRTAPE